MLSSGDASPDTACHHATYPIRPTADDPSTTQNVPVVAAMEALDVGLGDGGPISPNAPLPPLGWDLDGVCTCPDPPSCMQAHGPPNCDDDAGRDHTGLELFRRLGPSAQMSNAAANQALQIGEYGLVVQITAYNGQRNDRQVSVALYASSGVLSTVDGGVPQLQHDGSDKWTVDPRYLSAGQQLIGIDCDNGNSMCSPAYVDDNAYVADSVLVASLGEVPITFGGRANLGGAVMDLSETILVGTLTSATLSGNGTGWAIENGSISGRWGSAKLLSNMATIPDPLSEAGAFLCGPDVPYQALKPYICSLQDIAANSSLDRTGAPCDAISMAFGFRAEPARLGVVTPLPATPAGCADGGVPFRDTCSP